MTKIKKTSLLTFIVALALGFFPLESRAVELPRTYLNTDYPSLSSSRTVRTVKASCGDEANCYTSLQAAIDEASLGDEVVVDAGLVIDGPITLKEKLSGSGWIIIRSANLSSLPREGQRVSPSDASNMPKIVSPGSNLPALRAADQAHHYRIVGIEFKEKTPNDDTNVLVELGKGESYCAIPGSPYVVCADLSVLNNYSHNIILDRVYIHGDPTHNTKVGVGLNNKSSAVIDSYISDIHVVGQDAQGIVGAWGPGPYKIVNNYVEAAGENILFGGDDPRITGLIPSDIEVRNNHLYKPLSWRQGDPSFNGRTWQVKNLFQLKNAQRVLVDGNVMENNWSHAQPGVAVLFNTTNQGGKCTWCAVTDVTFTNNIVRHSGGGVSFQANDYNHANTSTGRTRRIKVSNNLFYDLSGTRWKNLATGTNAASYLFYLPSGASKPGPEDVEISNNTGFHSGNLITVGHKSGSTFYEKPGFVFVNNIAAHNSYGVFGEGASGFDGPSIDAYFPNTTFRGNVIVGQRSSTDTRDWSGNYTNYPGNFFPKTWEDVGFVSYSGGNFELSGSSAYKNAGTNGRDIGANMSVLSTVESRAISGNAGGSSPPPTPPVSAPSSPSSPSSGGGGGSSSGSNSGSTPTSSRSSGGGGGGSGSSSGSSLSREAAISEIEKKIAELMIQLANMQGRSSTSTAAPTSSTLTPPSSASTSFTQNLTVGSSGPEVTKLQQMLVSSGHLVMPPGVSYGYFGELTRQALSQWQYVRGISPAAGYWGPISRSRAGN